MDTFFDFSKPKVIRNIQVSGIDVKYIPDHNKRASPKKRPLYGTEYAENCREFEMENLKLKFDDMTTTSSNFGTPLEDVFEDKDDSKNSTCSKFQFKPRQRKDLPIYKYRHEIVDKINNNPVVVLTGSTGCGKSTQIPQYIIDDAAARKVPCQIIVTQPRKIAAITIAQRVAKERNCELGTLVGYQVGLSKKFNECENTATKLLFCTTGVILSKLVVAKEMNKYTHIILDEVHERDIDMDFLLIIVKRLLALNSKNTKVILMSATVDAKRFADYFSYEMNGIFGPAKVINLEPCMNFEVEIDYLESLQYTKYTDAVIDYMEPMITEEMYVVAQRVVMITLRSIKSRMNTLEAPSILIFLPGIHEIENFHRFLSGNKDIESNSKICVLHSTLSTQEQKIAFTSTTKPKIILSTNIAESSVTIPDIEYVIDFCLTKYLMTVDGSNMSALQTDWASQQNCEQRAGRVGRVSRGRVFRLVHKSFYDKQMSKYSVAEMLRIPLETVVLKTKILNMGSPASILALAMDPPPLSNILNSILLLKELGALIRLSENGTFDREDGELTYIGTIMAALPIDVRVSKLIVLGYLFSVLEETIIIGAGLNIKSIFRHMYQKKLENYSHKLNWADGSGCDSISILNAYKLWNSYHEQGLFQSFDSEHEWCKRFNLEERNLYEMRDLVKEIQTRLQKVKIEEVNGPLRAHWDVKEKPFIIKMCIAGAFLPYYFTQNANDDYMEREVCKILSNLQPHNTVYFKNMNNNLLGTLYQNQIQQHFVRNKVCSNPDNIKVTFDLNKSQKVFVTFLNGNTLFDDGYAKKVGDGNVVCGKILPEVYKSVNMRRLIPNFKLHTMDREKGIKYALENGFGSLKDGIFSFHDNFIKRPELCVLPTNFMHRLKGIVTNIVHANKFHFQPTYSTATLHEIEFKMESVKYEIFEDLKSVADGMFVIVSSDKGYRRGKVVKVINIQKIDIYLIDYGSVVQTPLIRIHSVPQSIKMIFEYPPQCFECTLSEIQPSFIKCPKEKWTNEAVKVFEQMVDSQDVTIDIYSVVDDVVSVQMTINNVNINEKLVEEKYALPCEESYASKMDKDMRERQKIEKARCAREEYATKENKNVVVNIVPPHLNKCLQVVSLNGPFSPLEAQLYGITRKSTKVTTDSTSCNSIILDTNSQNGHGKLFVATNVSKNQRNCDIILRQITMMPNIPGLAVLLGMIFCPTMEMRRDENNTRYVSVLTGLGCDELTNEPYFAEHDCIFPVDIELSPEDDLGTINHLRYSMSYLLLTTPNEEFPCLTEQQKAKLLLKVKELILKIMCRERPTLESYLLTDSDCWEGEIDDCLKRKNIFGHLGIYNFHDVPYLQKKTEQQINALKKHSEELKNIAMMQIPTRINLCKLCNTFFDNVPELRIHLLSNRHKNREKQLTEELKL